MRRFFIYLIVSILALIGVIEVTGNHHLYFTLQHTVFKGRLSPSIDEYGIFPNRLVIASNPQPWPYALSNTPLDPDHLNYVTSQRTAALLFIKSDTIRYAYYDDEHSDTSHINPWSSSKSVVALLVVMAIEDGFINDLDDPLSNYLDGYAGSGITIRHLLAMSSGINFTESYTNPFTHSAKSLYGNDLKKLNDDYVPTREPFQYFDYQGGNTILLGMLLEKVLNSTISDYASRRLWSRIGAEHSVYWSLDHEGGLERVFCCFNSTATDFARIGRLMLHDGVWNGDTLLSSQMVADLITPTPLLCDDGSQNERYGLHWWVLNMENYKGFYTRGIQGQYVIVIPDEELIVVRFGDLREEKNNEGHRIDALKYVDMARQYLSD